MRISPAWLIILVLIFGVVFTHYRDTPEIRRFDAAFEGWIFSNSESKAESESPVVIVGIDEASLELTEGWPWEPIDYALFLKAMESSAPAVVLIDHSPQWSGEPPPYIGALVQAAYRTPHLLVPYPHSLVDGRLAVTPGSARELSAVTGNRSALPQAPVLDNAPAPALLEAASTATLLLQAPGDGLPAAGLGLLARLDEKVYPTLPLEAYRILAKVPTRDLRIHLGDSLSLPRGKEIPISEKGELTLDYALLDKIETVPYSELIVLSQQANGTGENPPSRLDAFTGKAVILGRTDRESRTLLTPLDRRIAPAQLLALAIATLTAGDPPGQASAGAWYAICLVMAALAAFSLKLGNPAFWRATLAFACCYPMGALAINYHYGLLLPASLPVAIMLFVVLLRILRPAKARGKV